MVKDTGGGIIPYRPRLVSDQRGVEDEYADSIMY